MGVSGSVCCDHLRCTKCGHRVVEKNHVRWDSSVDYLFARNWYPHWEELGKKLLHKAGATAYTCQCTWITAEGEARNVSQWCPRWACLGH